MFNALRSEHDADQTCRSNVDERAVSCANWHSFEHVFE
jgi:hypothetical protein